MKIKDVKANNRKKAFEVSTSRRKYVFPYARLRLQPSTSDVVREVYADPEVGNEGFTYVLASGKEDTVPMDAILDYNRDPDYMQEMLLYDLTAEALNRLESTELSRREIIRRLGTSATQFYRLIDTTNYRKSIGQMISLLHILDAEVELKVRDRKPIRAR